IQPRPRRPNKLEKLSFGPPGNRDCAPVSFLEALFRTSQCLRNCESRRDLSEAPLFHPKRERRLQKLQRIDLRRMRSSTRPICDSRTSRSPVPSSDKDDRHSGPRFEKPADLAPSGTYRRPLLCGQTKCQADRIVSSYVQGALMLDPNLSRKCA